MNTVVFLPGFNSDALVWRPVSEGLSHCLDSVALDLPAERSLERLVDQVAQQIPERSLIVGHSFGGIVAMCLAERYPHLVAGLVLVSVLSDADSDEVAADRLSRAVRARAGAFEEVVMAKSNMRRVLHSSRVDNPVIREERLRSTRAYGVDRYFAHSLALIERPDRSDFLSTLNVPVLVIAGSHDRASPTDRQRNWAKSNGVPFVEIADTGHMVPAEEPVLLGRAIDNWWKTKGDQCGQ